MPNKVQLRRDTYANWTTANPTLAAGEQAFETDTGLLKVGNGSTAYNTLSYMDINTYRLTADGSAIGSAIADYFPVGTITLDAGGVYEFVYELFFLKTTAGTVTFTLTSSQTPVQITAYYIGGPVAGIQAAGAPITAGLVGSTSATAALPATTSLTNAVNHHFTVKCIVEVNATNASTFRLRATESAGTITPLRNSNYTVRRLPAANIGIFS